MIYNKQDSTCNKMSPHAKHYKKYFIVMIQHASFEGKATVCSGKKQSFLNDYPVPGVQIML